MRVENPAASPPGGPVRASAGRRSDSGAPTTSSRGEGHREGRTRARSVRVGADGPIHGTRERPSDSEADAGASECPRPRGVNSIEALEDLRALLRAEAGPVVDHREFDRVAPLAGLDSNRSSVGAVADRICEVVAEDLD